MAIYLDSIPYMVTQNKSVALPKSGEDGKTNYGSLVFTFTPDIGNTIKMINNRNTCYHDGKYRYFYYNLTYRGTIAGRRYNIKDINERKNIYDRISKDTVIKPHPPSMLNQTPNMNCYFDMSKYISIFEYMTSNFTPTRKVNIFWNFFKSVWFSEQTSTYDKKTILIDADMYPSFKGGLKENIKNPLFMIYYTLYKYPEMITNMDIDIAIYCKKTVLKINPSMCDEKTYSIFKRELFKVMGKANNEAFSDKSIDEDEQKEILKDKLQKRYNLMGSTSTNSEVTSLDNTKKEVSKEQEEFNKKVNEKIDKTIDSVKTQVSDIVSDDADKAGVTEIIKSQSELELDKDDELAMDMYKLIQKEKVPTKPVSSARDAYLREKQEQLMIGNISMKDIDTIKAGRRPVPEKDVSSHIKNINPNVKKTKYANINKDYIENIMPQDIIKSVKCLNNKSTNFYITNIKIEDTSNELNYKETYYISLKDENGVPHSLTVDIPKFLENKFLYLGGNKKIINRQNFLYPVVKTAPDTVQIVTNYNKLFIRRIGTKSISSVERFMKLITNNDSCYKLFTTGNNSPINQSYLTTIEYDEFSKVLTTFKTDNCLIFFNQKEAHDYMDKHQIELKSDNLIFIGVKDKQNIFLDADTQLTTDGQSICDLLFTELPEDLQKEFNKTRSTKKTMYNTATIMSQSIPFVVLLMYWEGISSLFKKMNLKYTFFPRFPSEVKPNESVIRFKDCFVVYEEDLATSLLLNGIKVLDTENYNMLEYDTPEPYVNFFKKVYGKVSIMNAIYNYYEFTLDPITIEVLEDVNLPTDLISLCIYANNLLADESYTIENSQTLSRIRSIEIIPAILYNRISSAFLDYKNSGGKRKLSIPKDCVIKDLLALQTVEDYSTLNPKLQWGIM